MSEEPQVTSGRELSQKALDPVANAAGTAPCFSTSVLPSELSYRALAEELAEQSAAVSRGDLTRPEAMLIAQAHTLDGLFNYLLVEARETHHMLPERADRYLRVALRAQNQCRATLQTLAELRNPTMVIAHQANITHGPQQVNNAAFMEAPPALSQSAPTEQSGGTRELLQDARAPTATFGTDPTLAAVGEVHRAEDAGGQGEIVAEPLARRAT